jgi:PAS domain-containing protein
MTENSLTDLIERSEVIAKWTQEDLENFVALLGQDVPSSRSQCSEGRSKVLADQKRRREALLKQHKTDLERFDAQCRQELVSEELKQVARARPFTPDQVRAASIVDACPVPSMLLDKDIRIIHVNDHWLAACKCVREELLGSTLSFLQGPLTSKQELQRFNEACAQRIPASVRLVNYRADRMPIWNTIQAVPVEGGGFITTHHIVPCNPAECYPAPFLCQMIRERKDLSETQGKQSEQEVSAVAAMASSTMLAASQQVAAILQGTILNPLKRENAAMMDNLDALHAWSKKQKCSADPPAVTGTR